MDVCLCTKTSQFNSLFLDECICLCTKLLTKTYLTLTALVYLEVFEIQNFT